MREIRIDAKQEGQRLDKFLRRYLPEAGNGFLYRMLRKKNIVLNDHKATGRELLAASDIVKLYFSDETLHKLEGSRTETDYPALPAAWIIYEDGDILAVNKPAGLLTQRSRPEDISLNEYLKGYLADADPRLFRTGAANRLDRNTSGIVLAGKHLPAAQMLSEQIRTRGIRKYYLTLVTGVIREPVRLCGYLTRDPKSNISHIVQADPGDGSAAAIETGYEPLAYPDIGLPATLLKVDLITGRTHQIRAHLASAGHPVIGDVKYGDPSVNRHMRAAYGLKRPYLHAWKMIFPEDLQKFPELCGREIIAPLPEDLRAAADYAPASKDPEGLRQDR